MWRSIDKEMGLNECKVYCYSPEEDPYDGEEGAIWSLNYFFFNKTRKRVCYIYLRGLSIISHSPIQRAPVSTKRSADGDWGRSDSGAHKRAKYWLGDRANGDISGGWGEDDDEDVEAAFIEQEMPGVKLSLMIDDDESGRVLSADGAASPSRRRDRSKSTIRGISEDIAESMEI